MVLKLMGLDYSREHMFHPKRKWRFDYAIPSKKIAIEYEGIVSDKSRHTNIKGYTEDSNKYNEAQKLGWKVLRYTAMNYKNITNDLMELNVFGLGEVAEPKSQIEVQMFKIKNECL